MALFKTDPKLDTTSNVVYFFNDSISNRANKARLDYAPTNWVVKWGRMWMEMEKNVEKNGGECGRK